MSKPLPATAPRGKVFRVAKCSHVAGRLVRMEFLAGRYTEKAAAMKACESVDARLSPAVVLMDA